MKQISSTPRALFFVRYTLLSMLSVNSIWERGPLAPADDGARVSEVGSELHCVASD